MDDASAETQFFHSICPRVIDFVKNYRGDISISVSKREGDYATQVDLAVEEMIVDEIRSRFPDDSIKAEEGHSQTDFATGRTWLVDPICGTMNLRRGLNNFCTNIALANDGKLIAGCVIDHPNGNYIWSVGNHTVHINESVFTPPKPEANIGRAIDVNLGALANLPRPERKKHVQFIEKLLTNTDYYNTSMTTSLAFAYAAIGKLDGFISPYDKPWDIAAASFLIQQAGGIITQANGDEWQLQPTISSIGSLYPAVHSELLAIAHSVGY